MVRGPTNLGHIFFNVQKSNPLLVAVLQSADVFCHPQAYQRLQIQQQMLQAQRNVSGPMRQQEQQVGAPGQQSRVAARPLPRPCQAVTDDGSARQPPLEKGPGSPGLGWRWTQALPPSPADRLSSPPANPQVARTITNLQQQIQQHQRQLAQALLVKPPPPPHLSLHPSAGKSALDSFPPHPQAPGLPELQTKEQQSSSPSTFAPYPLGAQLPTPEPGHRATPELVRGRLNVKIILTTDVKDNQRSLAPLSPPRVSAGCRSTGGRERARGPVENSQL